jgi:peptide/nickel transport system permease protein
MKKLLRHPSSFIGIIIIGAALLVAVLGANIRMDQTPFANDMLITIANREPGFEATVLKIAGNKAAEVNFFSNLFFGGTTSSEKKIALKWWKIEKDTLQYREFTDEGAEFPVQSISLHTIVGTENVKGLNGEQLKNKVESEHIVQRKYYFGTDKFGRDYLSRLMGGSIVSLAVGFIAVIVSLLIGVTLGAFAGFFRGRIDDLIVWFTNVVWSIPTLLMVMAITLMLGKGFWQIFVAVGLTMWVEVARVTRGQFLSLREKEFVEAGKVLGFSNKRIIFRHILPNTLGPLVVISASNFATAILIEAGLSFLGIGAQPPMPSWGSMIKEHYGYILLDKAYLAIFPGVAISLLVLAFVLLGNGIRDVFDIKRD